MVMAGCGKEPVIPPEGDWSFVVFSDVQQGYGVYGRLSEIMGDLEPAPALAVCCGDIMLRPGNEVEWKHFWEVSSPVTSRMPLYIARGNHEGNDPASEEILCQQLGWNEDHFYRAVQAERSLFLILDTYRSDGERSITGEQWVWLREELETARRREDMRHIFIFMHHPLFPQGQHAGSPLENREELHKLFIGHPKIKAVFCGHEHMFLRYFRDDLDYITTGGGGGVLYHGYGGDYHHFTRVSVFEKENRIHVQTIGIFHEVVDDFDL